jgi:hypothetical protein
VSSVCSLQTNSSGELRESQRQHTQKANRVTTEGVVIDRTEEIEMSIMTSIKSLDEAIVPDSFRGKPLLPSDVQRSSFMLSISSTKVAPIVDVLTTR